MGLNHQGLDPGVVSNLLSRLALPFTSPAAIRFTTHSLSRLILRGAAAADVAVDEAAVVVEL